MCLAIEERHGGKCGLLLVAEAEGTGGNVGNHAPDRDYVPGGSCHTCPRLHPGLCPSGRHCTRRGSCLSHSEYLMNYAKYKWMLILNSKTVEKNVKGGYVH